MQADTQKHNVHKVLAHSYSAYFILFLVGVILDLAFPMKLFSGSFMVPTGIMFLILATIIILWAQKAGRDLREAKQVTTEHFCRGPYCYTRAPTHWGLFLMLLGFGVVTNAFFVVLFTLAAFFIGKFFIGKQEALLEKKYGAPYSEYKKLVKF